MTTQTAEQTMAKRGKLKPQTRIIQLAVPGARASGVIRAATQPEAKTVTFRLECPQAKRVLLAGSFNNWEGVRTPLRRDGNGSWKASLSLSPGRYEYRFIVDGEWLSDPKAPESVPNQFGSCNSVVAV